MKKLFYFLSLCLVVTACSSEDSPILEEPLTPMNALPSVCSYDIGDASCATASYTFETRTHPQTGNPEKIMTFRGLLTGERDAHHAGTFRVRFYKDAEMKEIVLDDDYINNEVAFTLDMNVSNYRESKLFVLFQAPLACSASGEAIHGFLGETTFDPYSDSGSGTFRFKVVNGMSTGDCSYPLGNAAAYYSLEQKENPQTGTIEKIMNFNVNLWGYCDPHHAEAFRIHFYEDASMSRMLPYEGYVNSGGTATMELNVTHYNASTICVKITAPYRCSTGDYRSTHYFLGEAPFTPYDDSGRQTFEFVTVSK